MKGQENLNKLLKTTMMMQKQFSDESIFKYQMQLEEHESKTSKPSVQPSGSTRFRSFAEIINAPSSFSNCEVNETPYYHTFAMTGIYSQAIASDVDGTPRSQICHTDK